MPYRDKKSSDHHQQTVKTNHNLDSVPPTKDTVDNGIELSINCNSINYDLGITNKTLHLTGTGSVHVSGRPDHLNVELKSAKTAPKVPPKLVTDAAPMSDLMFKNASAKVASEDETGTITMELVSGDLEIKNSDANKLDIIFTPHAPIKIGFFDSKVKSNDHENELENYGIARLHN